jgi:predicted Fe-Mo cluster-binding NifX family protein
MKVAIPVFDGRVSPVFDWAERLEVADLGGDGPADRERIDLSGMPPPERVGRLVALGVGTLLCGAISAPVLALAEARGVKVVPWLCGDAEDVLAAFERGELPADRFAMPGCCGRRRRRCRAGRRRGRQR